MANAQQELSKSLLRLTNVLQQSMQDSEHSSQSAVQLLLAQPVLMENLRKAHVGNFGVVLSLLGCLEHGPEAKKLVDRVIDACKCSQLGICICYKIDTREQAIMLLTYVKRYLRTALDILSQVVVWTTHNEKPY